MNHLTDEQIEFITQVINKSVIQSPEMKEDLIDHFCCAIEEDIQKGWSFQTAYDKAYHTIAPNGFDEIQRETIYLLTSKKLRKMKRLLYLSGYLSLIGITATIFMKLAHLPYSQLVLLLTAFIVVFLFLPTLFVSLYKRDITTSGNEKLKYVFGFIGVALLVAFAIFQLSHWPGAIAILLSSLVILNFMVFPFLFLKMYRKTEK